MRIETAKLDEALPELIEDEGKCEIFKTKRFMSKGDRLGRIIKLGYIIA